MYSSGDDLQVRDLPWFKVWFDSLHYHKLYSERDENEAEGIVHNLLERLKPASGSRMLDLGCGSGRHSKVLASKGLTVTGLDLSFNSIREAKKSENNNLRFIQHDMRIPFGKNHFDYVFNFFTSFGYFKTKEENDAVIKNIADSLKRGGKLILDYMNVNVVKQKIVPAETKEIDGVIYNIARWMDEKYFYKKISFDEDTFSGSPEYTEQVARFNLVDFMDMFAGSNLRIKEIFGDYQLNNYDLNSSPRLIMLAEKTGE